MQHKRGFFLIECCMYIAICAILTATIMRWIAQTMIEAGKYTIMVQKGVAHTLLYDVIIRDIQSAPCDSKAWRIEPAALMWKLDEKITIEWSLDHKKLIRKEGLYDKARKHWGKHHTSTIAYGVDIFTYNVHKYEGGIKAVEIMLGIDGAPPHSQYIRLRNGRLHA